MKPIPAYRVAAFSIARSAAFVASGFAVVILTGTGVSMFVPHLAAPAELPTVVLGLAVPPLLAATWVACRLHGRPLGDVGLQLDGQRARELAGGLAMGAAAAAALGWGLMLAGAVSWQPNPAADGAHVMKWLAYFTVAAVVEELIFRGYALRTLADGIGSFRAVALSSLVFGGYHVLNLGTSASVQPGGWDLVWRVAGPAVGGVLFGLAAVRTRGLALPIGLHLGWNVLQWALLSMEGPAKGTGFLLPVTGPAASPGLLQGAYVAAMAALAVATALATRPTARPLPGLASPAGPLPREG